MFTAAVLVVASTLTFGQSDGEKAFKSYTDLAVGGTWTTTIGGQKFEDSYERILDGQFVRLTSKAAGGFPASVVIIGIDPVTKKCTWQGFDADGKVSSGTTTLEADGVWIGEFNGQGPKGTVSSKGRLTKVDEDTIKYEILNQTVTGSEKPFPTVSIWKRERRTSNAEHLKKMESFIGSWEAKGEEGGTTRWTFEWGRNKNFIENEIVREDSDGNVEFANKGMLGWDRNNQQFVNNCMSHSGNRVNFYWVRKADDVWETRTAGSEDTWTITIVDQDTWRMKVGESQLEFKRKGEG